MAYGLKVWDGVGNMRIDDTVRTIRVLAWKRMVSGETWYFRHKDLEEGNSHPLVMDDVDGDGLNDWYYNYDANGVPTLVLPKVNQVGHTYVFIVNRR